MGAARIILDQTLREPGDRRSSFPLRQILNKRDAELAMFNVLSGTAAGRITLTEARAIIKPLLEYVGMPDAPGTTIPKKKGKDDRLAISDEWGRRIERWLRDWEAANGFAKEGQGRKKQGRIEKKDTSDSKALERATAGADRRLKDAALSIAGMVIDEAIAGNMAAAKLALDTALQPADRPIAFRIRKLESKQDAAAASGDVFAAMDEKRITREEGEAFLKLLGDVVGAPEVPTEVVATEVWEASMQKLLPEMLRRATEKNQPDGDEVGPLEIFLELEQQRRARRSRPWW
jgi:hypothetical protein